MTEPLQKIEEACLEIVELLKVGYCQRHLVLTEVEIILENINKLHKILPPEESP